MTRDELRKQLKDDIAEFYATFRQQYLALRRKHIKQLKELRRLTNDNRSTGEHTCLLTVACFILLHCTFKSNNNNNNLIYIAPKEWSGREDNNC